MAALTEDVALTALVDGRCRVVQTHRTLEQRDQSLIEVLQSHWHFNSIAAGLTTDNHISNQFKGVSSVSQLFKIRTLLTISEVGQSNLV